MAKTEIYTYYKDLPPWAKGVVVVGSLGLVGAIIYQVYSRIKKDAGKKQAEQAVKETEKELKDEIKNGVKPTISTSQADAWAGQIQKAFDGCDPAETSKGVVAQAFLGLKNNADFLLLVSRYGVRKHDQCGWFTGDFEGDLYQAIVDELTNNERNFLNDILAKKGITYKV